MECKERPYEGDFALDREKAIKLWNISTNLVGAPIPVLPLEIGSDDKYGQWQYIGRKRRTAL